jgi:hypothetical protein
MCSKNPHNELLNWVRDTKIKYFSFRTLVDSLSIRNNYELISDLDEKRLDSSLTLYFHDVDPISRPPLPHYDQLTH